MTANDIIYTVVVYGIIILGIIYFTNIRSYGRKAWYGDYIYSVQKIGFHDYG